MRELTTPYSREPRTMWLRLRLGYLAAPASAAIALIAWELWVAIANVPRYLVPAPHLVAAAMVQDAPMLLPHAWVTIEETLIGFGGAVVIALPLSVAIVVSKPVARSVFPLIVVYQVVPKVALAPLFVLWLGFGIVPKILMVALLGFFPIVINAVAGLRSIETEQLYLLQSIGASRWQLFWKLRFPKALPAIMGGLKIAATFSVIGAVVAEFVGAEQGLGRALLDANGNFDTVLLFTTLLYLVLIGVLFFLMVQVLERLVIPWHVSTRFQNVTRLM